LTFVWGNQVTTAFVLDCYYNEQVACKINKLKVDHCWHERIWHSDLSLAIGFLWFLEIALFST